jgi:putative peptidoglycan lipid II flippase
MLELGRLMGPRILILGMFQFVFLFTTRLASRLEAGSITALNMGWIMMQMPEVIFAMAIATAAFPTMSQLVAQSDGHRLRETTSATLRAIVALTFPSVVALLMLGRPYIALLFRSAAFDARAANMVYHATAAFTAGLVGHSILELAARVFYAHKNTIVPFWAALAATVLNVALCLVLAPRLGQAGLALANSVAVTLQSGVLLWLGWRTRVRFEWRAVWSTVWRAGLASAAMAGILALVIGQQASWGTLRIAVVGSALGGGVYVGLMALLSPDEVQALVGLVRLRRAGS